MSKLREILKPKISKEEGKALARLIFKRFADILEKHKHLCIGDDCELCWYYGDLCDFAEKSYNEMLDVVENISDALDVGMWLDWDGDCILLDIWGVKPEDDDDDWVFSNTLRVSVWVGEDFRKVNDSNFFFEPESLADRRDEFKSFVKRMSEYWLEDVLSYFWRLR